MLSVEVNNQEQVGPECSLEESVTTIGINKDRGSANGGSFFELKNHNILNPNSGILKDSQ